MNRVHIQPLTVSSTRITPPRLTNEKYYLKLKYLLKWYQ
jgi:hypothetical protein